MLCGDTITRFYNHVLLLQTPGMAVANNRLLAVTTCLMQSTDDVRISAEHVYRRHHSLILTYFGLSEQRTSVVILSHHVYFPLQLVGWYILSVFVDNPWSQLSPLSSSNTCISFSSCTMVLVLSFFPDSRFRTSSGWSNIQKSILVQILTPAEIPNPAQPPTW